MKLKKDPVSVETLEEYLADASDFAFELRILEMLTAKGISSKHGGQYKDPDTKKFREFDIRSHVTRGQISFAAAIECKSIGHHFPLLVSCVPRSNEEAYHQIFKHQPEPGVERHPFDIRAPQLDIMNGKDGVMVTPSPLYPQGAPVGKSTAQVGRRDTQNAELHANDAEFFEKWSQALQSLHDLFEEMASKDFIERKWDGVFHASMVLPIVVVPNGTLWTVSYNDQGHMEGRPAHSDRVSIYIDRSYYNPIPGDSLQVSHLEVMTESGLSNFCDTYLTDPNSMRQLALAL